MIGVGRSTCFTLFGTKEEDTTNRARRRRIIITMTTNDEPSSFSVNNHDKKANGDAVVAVAVAAASCMTTTTTTTTCAPATNNDNNNKTLQQQQETTFSEWMMPGLKMEMKSIVLAHQESKYQDIQVLDTFFGKVSARNTHTTRLLYICLATSSAATSIGNVMLPLSHSVLVLVLLLNLPLDPCLGRLHAKYTTRRICLS